MDANAVLQMADQNDILSSPPLLPGQPQPAPGSVPAPFTTSGIFDFIADPQDLNFNMANGKLVPQNQYTPYSQTTASGDFTYQIGNQVINAELMITINPPATIPSQNATTALMQANLLGINNYTAGQLFTAGQEGLRLDPYVPRAKGGVFGSANRESQ